jgi:UDP-3-O-[3-hydroxymyristoyl] glucosamine N-acyltransferase
MTSFSTTTQYPDDVIAPSAAIHESYHINAGARNSAETILAPEVVIGKNVLIEGNSSRPITKSCPYLGW